MIRLLMATTQTAARTQHAYGLELQAQYDDPEWKGTQVSRVPRSSVYTTARMAENEK